MPAHGTWRDAPTSGVTTSTAVQTRGVGLRPVSHRTRRGRALPPVGNAPGCKSLLASTNVPGPRGATVFGRPVALVTTAHAGVFSPQWIMVVLWWIGTTRTVRELDRFGLSEHLYEGVSELHVVGR